MAQSLSTITFEGTTLDIIDRDGMPWLSAADIARALGYARTDAVGSIYRRNRDEFTDRMALTVNLTVNGFGGGNSEKPILIFSPRGAHLIAMFARTDRAKAFRKWVLDVLDTAAPTTITPAQKLAIRNAIDARVKTIAPEGMTKATYKAIYHALYTSFQISSYGELPAARFDEAIAFINRYSISRHSETPITAEQLAALRKEINAACSGWLFSGQEQQHIHNLLRVTFDLQRVDQLPARCYSAALEMVATIARNNARFMRQMCEIKDEYISHYMCGDQPWTPSVKVKMRRHALDLPERPDWRALHDRMALNTVRQKAIAG